MDTKNEIKEIFKNYKISIEKISNDKDIQLLMQNMKSTFQRRSLMHI